MILVFIFLLVIGIPVAYSLSLSSFLYLFLAGLPITTLITRMVGSLNSFTLMAVPFFILAGQLMSTCGLTTSLVKFVRSLVGHFKGGLAQVNIVASIIFAGMSGAALADAGGLGSVLIPAMEEDGYDVSFASAVTAASSIIGPIIPPSIPVVLYGVIAELSIGKLFMGGVIPGLLMGISMMILVRIEDYRFSLPVYEKASFVEFKKHLGAGLVALIMPVIIIGGILVGYFTPTEAAVIATVYALIVGVLILKGYTISSLIKTIINSMMISGGIMFIISGAMAFGWILAREGTTSQIINIIESLGLSGLPLLLVLNLLFILIGCFIEPNAALLLLSPILLPVILRVGINPYHFGIVMIMNLWVGLVTPPMGMALYLMQDIGDLKFSEIVKAMLPFYIPLYGTILLVTIFPQLVLWLPNLID